MHEVIQNLQAESEAQRREIQQLKDTVRELLREIRMMQELAARQANATTTLHARLAVIDRANVLGIQDGPN